MVTLNKLVVFIFLFGFWSALFIFATLFNISGIGSVYLGLNKASEGLCASASILCFPIFIWNVFVILLATLTYQIPSVNPIFVTILNVLGVINLVVLYLMVKGD